ncbi:deoxyribose-phosphate aldolase [candidate division KSB1 bacterium]|nr:deoxyribose-phosphate aldolase [candidate division KSB1 bacterium]
MNNLNEIVKNAIEQYQPTDIQKKKINFTKKDICQAIDHTLLKPDATEPKIIALCEQAINYNFTSVCVNPVWVSTCKTLLKNSSVDVCTVVGFPLGANLTKIKVAETLQALNDGADEIDMVLNVGQLRSGNYDAVYNDIRNVVTTASLAVVKIIIEACLLSKEEKITACSLALHAGAGYVKTSTGFSLHGAVAGDVALMRRVVGEKMGVKASGGIRDLETTKKMLIAGADRIGTSSGLDIIEQFIKEESQ